MAGFFNFPNFARWSPLHDHDPTPLIVELLASLCRVENAIHFKDLTPLPSTE